mgnify:CR=1 FL=1
MVVEDAVSTVEVIIRLVGLFAVLLVRRFGVGLAHRRIVVLVFLSAVEWACLSAVIRFRLLDWNLISPNIIVGYRSGVLSIRRIVVTAPPYIRFAGRLAFRHTVQLGCCSACGIVSPDILFAVLLERLNVIGLLFRHTGLLLRRFAGIPEIII